MCILSVIVSEHDQPPQQSNFPGRENDAEGYISLFLSLSYDNAIDMSFTIPRELLPHLSIYFQNKS